MTTSEATRHVQFTLEDYLAGYVSEFRNLRAAVLRLKTSLQHERSAHAATRRRLDALAERVQEMTKVAELSSASAEADPLSFLVESSHKAWSREQWLLLTAITTSVSDLCRVTRLHYRTVKRYLERFAIADRWKPSRRPGGLCFLGRDFSTWTAQEWRRLVDRTSSAAQLANVARVPLATILPLLARLEVDTRRWGRMENAARP
ncbi:MAG: hypothetical protein KC468_16190 [Myxococcales bacterium]|nr:hypothetical protein [Myxococcales bacterium]